MRNRLWTPLVAVVGLILLAGCGEQQRQQTVTGLDASPGSVAELDLGPLATDDGLTQRDLTGVGGTDFVTAGVGTRSNNAETITVEVPTGPTVTVEAVYLYWARRVVDPFDAPASEVQVDGSTVTGSVVGGPIATSGNGSTPVSYMADITGLGLVGTGASSFTVEDDAPGAEGASVLVFYDDGGTASELEFWDGVDFAWGVTSEPPWRQTAYPVTFTFPPSSAERSAELVLFVGDVDKSGRANELDITIGTTTETVNEPFVGADGLEWDNFVRDLTIPAGVTEVTVEPISPLDAAGNPASLVWAGAGLSIEPVEMGGGEGCTPGYWRQEHHFDSWIGYAPDDDLFGMATGFEYPMGFTLANPESGTDPDDLSMLDGLVLRGGGVNALIRHAVAALLNAASPDVDYDVSEAYIVSEFNAALDGGDVYGLKDELEGYNEQGCPLNGGPDEEEDAPERSGPPGGGPPSGTGPSSQGGGPPGDGPPGQGGGPPGGGPPGK